MSREILRPTCLKPGNKYCPGCMHSMSAKLIGQCLDELGITDKTIAVVAVGCSTMNLRQLDLDMVSCAHGRAPAVATGLKRTQPDTFMFVYQGDGDLASIGLAEIMCAANRGEHFTVIFANNSTYGMTGGQMAPTTLIGQKSTTSPRGRNAAVEGYPTHMCEILNTLQAPSYIVRCALNNPANIRKAKECIKKAFQYQLDGKAFSFVELLTNCPTNWGMAPLDTLKFMEENTIPAFPLGVFRDVEEGV